MTVKQKIIAAAIIGTTMLSFAKAAKADIFDGLRIPQEYSYQMDQRINITDGKTTLKVTPKFFGKKAWGFAAYSSTEGKVNDLYLGVGAIVEGQIPMLPTFEALIGKDGRITPYLSVYATKLFKGGMFEVSPRITLDLKSGKLAYGSTATVQAAEAVRVGLDMGGADGAKTTLTYLGRVEVDKNKFVCVYVNPEEKSVELRLGIHF